MIGRIRTLRVLGMLGMAGMLRMVRSIGVAWLIHSSYSAKGMGPEGWSVTIRSAPIS